MLAPLHGNHAGASSIQDGLLIDLSRLNSITLSEDELIAMIGARLRWIDVYTVLEERGLQVVGGRSATVGFAGFTLGGGISFLSRRYDWAVDNVRNYEVVLANGTIANVNRDSSPDLYFALRGGGNNFGIVTRFDFETYRHGPMSGGTTVFLMEDLESRRTALGLEDRWQWSMNSVLNKVNQGLFKSIGSLGLSVHSSDIIREFVALTDESQIDAGAHAYLFISNGGNAFGLRPDDDGPLFSMCSDPCHADNITVLTRTKIVFTVTHGYENAEDGERFEAINDDIMSKITTLTKEQDHYHPFIYQNYAGYGPENRAQLSQIQRKFDPEGVFTKLQPGYFKV
ncbi:hypothetical protein BDV12DRAFT_198522 [Aspergillus spectabilis]